MDKKKEPEPKKPDTLPAPRRTIRYQGLFDFDGLYAAMIDWAKNYGYMWHEIDYKHKVPSPKGAEQEWKWQMTKEVNEYVHFKILITSHGWDLTEVMVDVNGKKKPLTSGRIYIHMEGAVTFDWQKKFTGGPFPELLGKIYTRLHDRDRSNYWDTLHYRMYNLHAILKKYFDMQTTTHPYKGYLKEN